VHGITALGATVAIMGSNPAFKPTIEDIRLDDGGKNGKCWNGVCTAKYKGYERHLIYPYSEACKMNGPSTMCLKNAYKSPKTDPAKNKAYYLIDIQKPLFVTSNNYKTETNFVTKMNDAYTKGAGLL